MRVTICGTGAMACLFGSRLTSVADVELLGTWAEGIDAICNNGISIETESGRVSACARAGHLDSKVEPADLVLVLVKAWQTARVKERLERLLKPRGVALTLQNGLGNVEQLGPRAVLGVTTQGATLMGPGRVRLGGDGPTHIAAPAGIVEIFQQAGFEAYRCDPAEADALLWGKLAANCAINPLTALLGVPNGNLLEHPDAKELLVSAANECAAVARAKKIRLPMADPAAWACEVARRTASNRSSMLQDVMRGAPTEIEAINGALVREGLRLGVPTPVNRLLLQLIRARSSL